MSTQPRFDASGRFFVSVSSDNRIKLWDAQTGTLRHEYTHKLHLRHTYSAVDIHIDSSSANNSGGVIAVGERSGHVFVFDIASGEVKHELIQNDSSPITAVAFNEQGTSIWAASADKHICEFSLRNNSVVKRWATTTAAVLALSASGSHLLAIGGGEANVHNTRDNTLLHAYSGQSLAASCGAFTHDSKYFVSGGGSNQRYVTLFAVTTKQEKNTKQRAALHTFNMASPPISVAFSQHSDKKSYTLLAVSDSGSVSIWTFTAASLNSSSSSEPLTVIASAADSNSNSAAQTQQLARRKHAALQAVVGKKHSSSANAVTASNTAIDALPLSAVLAATFTTASQLLIARGSAVQPKFDSVAVNTDTEATTAAATITLDALPANYFNTDATSSNKRKQAAPVAAPSTIINSAHVNDNISITAVTQIDGHSKKQKRDNSSSSSHSSEHKANVELMRSLADRLAQADQLQERAEDESNSSKGNKSSSSKRAELVPVALPKAGSLQTIMSQALHSNDDTLLEYCLTVGSKQQSLVKRTVTRLTATAILPLLRVLVIKLQHHPNKAASILCWIRELLRVHVSYLLSLPSSALSPVLVSLHAAIDLRLANFNKLLRLSGRLELLLSQINKKASTGSNSSSNQPTYVYNEHDEDFDNEQQSGDEDDSSSSNGHNLNGAAASDDEDSELDALDFDDVSGSSDSDEDESTLLANGISHSDDGSDQE